MINLIYVVAALLLTALFAFGINYISSASSYKINTRKIGALMLAATTFAHYIYNNTPLYNIAGLSHAASPFNTPEPQPVLTALAVILIWLSYAAILIIVLSEFFGFKTLRAMVNTFAFPVMAVTLIFSKFYAIATLGNEAYSLSTIRLWLLVLQTALGLALPISYVFRQRVLELPQNKKETFDLVASIVCAIIAIMPCYVPQAFFRQIDPFIKLYDLTPEHRVMVYGLFLLPFLMFHALKNKSYGVKRAVLIYFSLAQLWVYVGRWNLEMLKDPLSWPLHLCNTAMFLIPMCLIFKMDRLFNFCLFINVIGAFLASVMPTTIEGVNAIGTERINYWVNHYSAFFMPLLLVALKLFKRPKFKEWIYAEISLTVYFLAMLFVNAWFTNYGTCDYFFLNSDFIASKLGLWAERTRDITASFTYKGLTFTFYPLYQALYYVVYVALTVGIWFLLGVLFSMWDTSEDRRNRQKDYNRMKKELNEYLGDKSIHEPVSGDSSPRLVLRNFSKRYGSNKHYSVNNVSFEVHGGEIFGFLGPNGAGKSTIIKSMVGIQTITSGAIEICGFDVDKQPVAAKLNTGFVPDHYALYENLTGREYINYIADLFQVDADYRNEVIEKFVERFQLTGSFDNQMKTYSHGMKQKITIMAALVHNPKVWILDEPLTGLDPTSIHEVKQCMKEHAANGNIVFFSSHIIDVVEKICDRIAIIKKGKLRACTTIKELNERGIELEEFYLSIINDGDDEHVPYEEELESTAEAATV